MKKAVIFVLGFIALAGQIHAQSDFDTYPTRTLISLVHEHDTPETKNADFAVSANPFPSKTAVSVVGEHRPIPKAKKDFVKLWFETRGLPTDRADGLENEYHFKEGDADFWLPVLKPLEPFIEKELVKGDAVELYYFFMGGYSKTAREWVFVVEEFRKLERPSVGEPQTAPGSGYEVRALASVIAEQANPAAKSGEYTISANDFRTKAHVVFTGDVRSVTGEKKRFLEAWVEARGLPKGAAGLLSREGRVRQGETEYWLPFRETVLKQMLGEVKKSDQVDLYVILAGAYRDQGKDEWVFVVGGYSK